MKMNKLLAVTLACSLFAATPVFAAQAGMNNEGPQTVQFADMDRKLAEAAEKAIEQYGNGKAFQLEEALKGEQFVDEKTKEGYGISRPRIGAPWYRLMRCPAKC